MIIQWLGHSCFKLTTNRFTGQCGTLLSSRTVFTACSRTECIACTYSCSQRESSGSAGRRGSSSSCCCYTSTHGRKQARNKS